MNKEIVVRSDKNLEVLFTIYNQIWTPFLDENVSERMLSLTKLMAFNYYEFEEFKNHKAIQLTRKILERSGTDLFLLAFYYDAFPNAKRIKEIPEKILSDINPDTKLALIEIDSLMKEVSNFYKESNFETFYKNEEYVYEIAIREVKANLPDSDFIPFLENYFGQEYCSYNFIVLPFFKGEFGMAHQVNVNSKIDNLSFISPFEPSKIDIESRIQYVGYESKEDILEWVVHEYSHIFFNSALEKPENLALLNKFESLYKPIKENPQIGNWFSVFGEHLAVAFEVRAAELLGDKGRSMDILGKHSDWFYLDHFVKQLIFYENNRTKYPSIDSFMPHLIESCEELNY